MEVTTEVILCKYSRQTVDDGVRESPLEARDADGAMGEAPRYLPRPSELPHVTTLLHCTSIAVGNCANADCRSQKFRCGQSQRDFPGLHKLQSAVQCSILRVCAS